MDPNATLDLIRAAVAADERADAVEAAENLRVWLRNGGFTPSNYPGTRHELLSVLSAVWFWGSHAPTGVQMTFVKDGAVL